MRINTKIAAVLGLLLAIAEAVQSSLSLGKPLHAVLSMAFVTLAGMGIVPAVVQVVHVRLPLHFAAVVTTIIGALEVIQQNDLHVGLLPHVIIAVVLILLTALGLVPAPAPAPASVTHSHRKASPDAR